MPNSYIKVSIFKNNIRMVPTWLKLRIAIYPYYLGTISLFVSPVYIPQYTSPQLFHSHVYIPQYTIYISPAIPIPVDIPIPCTYSTIYISPAIPIPVYISQYTSPQLFQTLYIFHSIHLPRFECRSQHTTGAALCYYPMSVKKIAAVVLSLVGGLVGLLVLCTCYVNYRANLPPGRDQRPIRDACWIPSELCANVCIVSNYSLFGIATSQKSIDSISSDS